ncbi:MAG: hypothetical protein WCC69_05740 [Pirellulales bacterium]
MAGPQDIQRYPRGLIDLLGMRATGETPHKLAQDMGGVLELLELYLFDRMVPNASTAVGAIAAVGDSNIPGLTVPSREIWLVFEISLSSTTTAPATGFTATAGILRNVGSGNVYNALTPPVVVGASAQASHGMKFDRPVLAGPGALFNVRCSAITGAPAATPAISIFYAAVGI